MATDSTSNRPAPAPPPEMELTELEIQRALEIKSVVNGDNEFESVSDFDYVQLALFTKGNLEEALFCLQGLRHFREEYNISTDPDKCVQEGMELLQAYVKQHPWFILEVECETRYGHNLLIMDYAAMYPAAVKAPEQWRVFLVGLYYIYQLLSPNFRAMRAGIVRVCELQGFGWKNIDTDGWRQGYEHFARYYPHRHKETTWVHSSVISNLFLSMVKTMTGTRVQRIGMGSGLDRRLDEFFKGDNPVEAEAMLVEKFRRHLMERYRNQKNFSLPPEDGRDNMEGS